MRLDHLLLSDPSAAGRPHKTPDQKQAPCEAGLGETGLVRIPPKGLRGGCGDATGAVAQLGEHLLCKQGVTGSIPVSSTRFAARVLGARGTVRQDLDPWRGALRQARGGARVALRATPLWIVGL